MGSKSASRIHRLGKNEVLVRKLGTSKSKIVKVKTGGKPSVSAGRMSAGTSQLNAGTRQYDRMAKACGDSASNGETLRAEALYKALPHEHKAYKQAREVFSDARHVAVDNYDRTGELTHMGRLTPSKDSFGNKVSYPIIDRVEGGRLDAIAYNRKIESESERAQAIRAQLDEARDKAKEFAMDAGLSAKVANRHAQCVRAALKAEFDGRAHQMTVLSVVKGQEIYSSIKLWEKQIGQRVTVERGKA